MTETAENAVEIPAPDANVDQSHTDNADAKAVEVENEADPSPAVAKADDDATEKVRSRIDELTRLRREAERDRDHWRTMATRAVPKEPERAPITQEHTQAKTLADFGYDEGRFQTHLLQEAEKRAERRVDERFKEREAKESEARRNADFAKRSAKFAKTVDDFHEVIQDPSVSITAPMAEVIKDSDEGPALAYYLGKNPDVAERIAGLAPLAAARELGRIESRLVSERERAKDKAIVSKAPPPPPKLEAANADLKVSADAPESDSLSTEDWLKRRNKQIARKR